VRQRPGLLRIQTPVEADPVAYLLRGGGEPVLQPGLVVRVQHRPDHVQLPGVGPLHRGQHRLQAARAPHVADVYRARRLPARLAPGTMSGSTVSSTLPRAVKGSVRSALRRFLAERAPRVRTTQSTGPASGAPRPTTSTPRPARHSAAASRCSRASATSCPPVMIDTSTLPLLLPLLPPLPPACFRAFAAIGTSDVLSDGLLQRFLGPLGLGGQG